MYKVIRYFTDLHDKDHPYNVGDVYPRKGVTVTEGRIAELAGSENRQKCPLIELVSEEAGNTGGAAKEAAEEPLLENMTVAQLKELAAQMGISTAGLKKKTDYIAVIGEAAE